MSLRKIAVQEEASRPDSARSTGSTGSKRVTFREEPQVHHVQNLKAHNRAPSPIPMLDPVAGAGRGRGKRGSPLRTGGTIRVSAAERKKRAAGGSKRNVRRVNVGSGRVESKYLDSGAGVGDGGGKGGRGSSRTTSKRGARDGGRGRGRGGGGSGGGESRRAKARAKQRARRPGRNPMAVCCARMGVGSKDIKLNAAARQAVNYLHRTWVRWGLQGVTVRRVCGVARVEP